MKLPHQFQRYLLLELIASGGMAQVYRAKSEGLGGFEKTVAVKIIQPHYSTDREFINMLIDEAKITAQLSHPNIVQVIDLFEHENLYAIVMEYIEGRDLRRIITKGQEVGKPILLPDAVFIAWGAANALDYAHGKADDEGHPLGIVHRDISPQNILVSFKGEIKLVDFGIAKAARRFSETQAGALKGKFAYMSPEQAEGSETDHRSDIFSLGVVLYEMATGTRLFKGDSDMSTLRKVLDTQVPPPARVHPGFPFELEQVIISCLNRDPRERFQKVEDFRDHLIQYLISSGRHLDPSPLAVYLQEIFSPEMQQKKRQAREEKTQVEKTPTPDKVVPAAPTPPRQAPVESPPVHSREDWVESSSFTEIPFEPTSTKTPTPEKSPAPPPPVEEKKPPAPRPAPSRRPVPQREPRSFPVGLVAGFVLAAAVGTGLWLWLTREAKESAPTPTAARTQKVLIPPPPSLPPETPGLVPAGGPQPSPPEPGANIADTTAAPAPPSPPGKPASAVSLTELKNALTAPSETVEPSAPAPSPAATSPSSPPPGAEPSPPGREVQTVKPTEDLSPVILPGEPGVLFLNILPWAIVYIDGEQKGRNTPIVGLETSPGIHIIRVVNPELEVDYTSTFEVQPGEIVRHIIDLTAD